MFALGQVWIGDYKVWVTTPVFTVDPLDAQASKLGYYEVSVSKIEPKPAETHYYVDIMEKFRWIFNLDDKNRPTKDTDMISYNSYLERKNLSMPLCKLNFHQVSQIFSALLADSWECT